MAQGHGPNGVSAPSLLTHTAEMDDPPCIVGMSCHLPGGVRSPSDLWDFVIQKRSAQGRVPPERFNIDGFLHRSGDDKNHAGVVESDGGYFLDDDPRQFDNQFFGINNLEAIYMDPAQRKLLEVVYECLEGAGVSMEHASGSNTGVYVGNFTLDYMIGQVRDPDYIHRYHATGMSPALMANRISYVFDMRGPSLTLDTACSSSMYALHCAIQDLNNGDCEGAIVACANLLGGAEQQLMTIKGGVVSTTSTCHTFDSSADGYGRGEAANALYIKKLSAARRDGDRIRAVIRGTAVNSDGRTPGISQPSSDAQEALIRRTYKKAGLPRSETDYIECHGTGTPVGDPIEVAGVAQAFECGIDRPLMIGSVKTNFGHGEAASAITSLIKVTLALEKGIIPPTFGIKKINPALRLDSFNMHVVQEPQSWPRALRRASVNSFGFGGANGHAILESLESYLGNERAKHFHGYHPARQVNGSHQANGVHPVNGGHQVNSSQLNDVHQINSVQKANGIHHANGVDGVHLRAGPALIPVSAASKHALEARLVQLATAIQTHKHDARYLENLAFTLSERRSHMRYRSFLIANGDGEGASGQPAGITSGDGTAETPPIVFVCTGQGAQYPGMAKELLQSNPSFAATIRSLDEMLQAVPERPNWTLEETILDSVSANQVHHVTRSQPLCTAVQIALIDMLAGWGVRPVSTVGHSSGEIAAAYAAGFLSAKQAILTAYYRGYAVDKLTTSGRMMAVGSSSEDAASLIRDKGLENQVRVSCVNSPKSVTLSGSTAGIQCLRQELEVQGSFVRLLETNGRPYHSHMMQEISPLYEKLLEPLFDGGHKRTTPSATMYSSVGQGGESLRVFNSSIPSPARYWCENLESPVQFGPAVEKLTGDTGKLRLVEIGPHAALKGPLEQIRKGLGLVEKAFAYTSTILRKERSDNCMLELAGTLFQHGYRIHWPAVNGLARRLHPVADLPPYPWDYSAGILYTEPRASHELRNRTHPRHELLGSRQLAGDGIEHKWRNILRLSEVPWLEDHKLESQILFPGAGYLCMAMEGLKQIQGIERTDSETSFIFRNVNFLAALVISEQGQGGIGGGPEMHTSIKPRKLSAVTTSKNWLEFSISSWADGQATLHCTGNITTQTGQSPIHPTGQTTTKVESFEEYEERPTEPVYSKLNEQGLCYGPTFQALTKIKTDSSRIRTDGVFHTRLTQNGTGSDVTRQPYGTHPVLIDACLQTPFIAVTAGKVSQQKAFLPIYIGQCQIRATGPADVGREGAIHTRSVMTSPGTLRASCTLSGGDSTGAAVINLETVRYTLYNGKGSAPPPDRLHGDNASSQQRHPCLRVCWKPDLLRLTHESENELRNHVSRFVAVQEPDIAEKEVFARLAALLDLAGHKNPRMRVLELDSSDNLSSAADWRRLLGWGSSFFSRCQSWTVATLGQGQIQLEEAGEQGPFDVVLIPTHAAASKFWDQMPQQIVSLVGAQGIVISRASGSASENLQARGFDTLDVGYRCLLAVPQKDKLSAVAGKPVVLLVGEVSSPSVTKLAKTLSASLLDSFGAAQVDMISLQDLPSRTITTETIFISFLEAENGLLPTMSSEQMDLVRRVSDTASHLLWVTGSDAMSGYRNPDLALSSGLFRCLNVEQPGKRFAVLDIGQWLATSPGASSSPMCASIVRALTARYTKDDREFIHYESMLHISRFVLDTSMNSLFTSRLKSPGATSDGHVLHTRLKDATPAQLSLGKVGQLSSLYFQELYEPVSYPCEGYVDVDVRAVSINAKDVYTMFGRVETQESSLALEFSGVVKAVGPNVDLKPGDRVVALAPNHWKTTERVHASAVHQLQPSEEFAVMSTLPVVYATAIYALRDRAQLQPGETVLIHAGAGAFGFAAISLALSMGATVYTTASTPAKRQFLMSELNLSESHIFNSRDASFASGVRKATDGNGVDVVVNSLAGDLLHDGWSCVAEFGRFVEIGKKDLVESGRLDMDVFLRNATFTAFDLSELFYNKTQRQRGTLNRLTKKALELYRSGNIRAVPITKYDVGNVVEAYRHFSKQGRVGKIVVTLENPDSFIPTIPALFRTRFQEDKVYLLVGCLGGLGRSLSRWMMSRGARNFVFLGRSGTNKPDARNLVTRLQDAGAKVHVVRGDVVDSNAVAEAVKACEAIHLPIGGAIQATMAVSASNFREMTSEAWHAAIKPKWQGTWNLHQALQGHAMDFFLLMSSLSGTLGSATESNYCAANSFLDAFAQWRSRQGNPTKAVGLGVISDVGYVHENSEVRTWLSRRGLRSLTEDEMLQMIDLSLMPGSQEPHLLTGLEPTRLRELHAQGFEVDFEGWWDPRSAIIVSSLGEQKVSGASKGSKGVGNGLGNALPAWLRSMSKPIVDTLQEDADADSLLDAVLQAISRRLSGLILLPLKEMDASKPIVGYGVDSLLAAEYRHWLWSALKVDVPLLTLTKGDKSMITLAQDIVPQLQ